MPDRPTHSRAPGADPIRVVTLRDDREVVDRRMAGLGLSAPRFATVEDVLRWQVVVQAQDIGPARWSAAQRLDPGLDVREPTVETALAAGRILRTHVLRPTWHFVLPDDIAWLLALTGPRIQALSAYMQRTNGLTDAVRSRSNELIASALEGGQARTRADLRVRLDAAGFDTSGFRIGYLMMHAEVTGLVCSGPPAGKVQTYALLAERAPRARVLDRDEALGEIVRRYFTSHGPATVNDFRTWSSLSAADSKTGLAVAGEALVAQTFRGLTWWSGAAEAARAPSAEPSPTVHLIQAYDEYLMGYLETKAVVDLDGAAAWDPTQRAVYVGVVLLDGQIAGHWKRTIDARTVRFDVQLRLPFDPTQRNALQDAADRQGAFLGVPAVVATTQLVPA